MRRFLSLAALATACVVLVSPTLASAHAVLDSSTPGPSTVVKESPDEIVLDFNETIENSLLSIRLFDSEQLEVNIGDAQRSSTDQSQAIADVSSLEDGVYVVVWRAVSADGHPVSGAFPFEVGNSSDVDANELLTRVLKGIDTESPLGTPLAVSRFLAYMALIVLVGAMVFAWGRGGFIVPAVVTALRRAVIAFAVGSVGILFLQGPYAAGRGWSAITDGSLLADVLPTRLGLASLARVVLVAGWGVLVLSLPRASHRWWKRLSQLATVATPVAVATGVAQALHLTGGLSNIFNSRYGTYLLLKTAIIGACLAIGFRLRLRMKSGKSTVTQLLSFEAVLLVVVIAVTALMVGTSPTATSASSTSFSSTQIQGYVVVDFSIVPTRVGAAEVHVYLTPPGGSLAPVDSVEMSFTLPARGIPAIPVDLIEIGPNHWSGVMQFPYSGKWTLESRVSPQPNSTLLYTADVDISD